MKRWALCPNCRRQGARDVRNALASVGVRCSASECVPRAKTRTRHSFGTDVMLPGRLRREQWCHERPPVIGAASVLVSSKPKRTRINKAVNSYLRCNRPSNMPFMIPGLVGTHSSEKKRNTKISYQYSFNTFAFPTRKKCLGFLCFLFYLRVQITCDKYFV